MAKATRKKKRGGLLIKFLLVLALLLTAAVGYMGYIVLNDCQVVFRNVTVELGQESLSIRDFMTDKAKSQRCSFVSDPSIIDLSKVGSTPIVLRHGKMTYTVTLTVQDTTAPTARIPDQWDIAVGHALPEAGELVSEIQDEARVTASYAREPLVPEDYSDETVVILLEDESGNTLEKECVFRYYGWLHESCTLELGQSLTPEMLLADPEKDADLLDPEELKGMNTVGEHTLTVNSGSSLATCIVTVEDTTAPVLRLQNVRKYPGDALELKEFVVSASDLSGEPELRAVEELPDCSKQGTYTVELEARDGSGNVTTQTATLWVSENLSAPEIRGASEALSVEKRSEPDFLKGVTAKDDIDKNCQVTVDTGSLNLEKAGTYYITYSATDSSGNVGTLKRKVVVEPDQEDTAALVAKIADTLPDDPESIRDYVHDNIAYSSHWGGDDPVWHGLTQNSGNCNVHARTLKALLEYKGYETQLIWVTNKSHYWLIIKLEEGWRHIDSTPSAQHEKIGLATDRVRYLNLNGRNWDRSQWPQCE